MSIRAFIVSNFIKLSRRYVTELIKMKETFLIPLLHPYAGSLDLSSTTLQRECDDISLLKSPVDSLEHLPIASRFLTPEFCDYGDFEGDEGEAGTTLHASREGGRGDLFCEMDPREPLALRKPRDSFLSLFGSHRSSSPSLREGSAASTKSLDRRVLGGPSPTEKDRGRGRNVTFTDSSVQRVQQKSKETFTKADLIVNGGVAPHQIPDDLRRCLEVIEDSILPGHKKLSKCLWNRYNEQFPLVRSLADIFLCNVRLLILLSYCADHRLSLVLDAHPSWLRRLRSAS